MTAALAAVAGLSVVLLAGVAGYFLVLQPRRWRLPLRAAFELLGDDDRGALEEADRLIGQAMTAGPRGRALSDARFTQAFVRAMLGRYDPDLYSAGATTVAELTAADGYDPAVAYLDLWLRARLEQHDRVCDLFEQQRTLLARHEDARYIAAISYLHRAVEHWRRREVQGALHDLDEVRELGELTDRIPSRVNDLELLDGIQAVFDERLTDARRSFTGARERAPDDSAAAAQADLGLIVCDVKSGRTRALDARLTEVLEALERNADEAPDTLLLAHTALFHVTALLREWLRLPAGAPLPDTERDRLERRIERVRTADRELGDALLIAGLCGYYLATDQGGRERGIALLEEGLGTAKAIMIPQVRDLVERERLLGDEDVAQSRYLDLLREYRADPAVPGPLRAELRRIQERYARFGDPSAVEADLEPYEQLTIDDQRIKAKLLHDRIRIIVFPRVRDQADAPVIEELAELSRVLEVARSAFAAGVAELQAAEHELIVRTGEFLLPEDGTVEDTA